MGKLWDRLRSAMHEAGTPPLPDPADLAPDGEPVRGRRAGARYREPVVSAAETRGRYPDTAPIPTGPHLILDAGALMMEGDPIAVGMRDVRQPEPGRHAFVVAIWYQVDPLQLQDGGRFELLPDQVLGTLPPACYFCEVSWSFAAMRMRCPGRPPRGVR